MTLFSQTEDSLSSLQRGVQPLNIQKLRSMLLLNQEHDELKSAGIDLDPGSSEGEVKSEL